MVSKPKTTEVWKEDELIEDNLIEDGRPQPQYEVKPHYLNILDSLQTINTY